LGSDCVLRAACCVLRAASRFSRCSSGSRRGRRRALQPAGQLAALGSRVDRFRHICEGPAMETGTDGPSGVIRRAPVFASAAVLRSGWPSARPPDPARVGWSVGSSMGAHHTSPPHHHPPGRPTTAPAPHTRDDDVYPSLRSLHTAPLPQVSNDDVYPPPRSLHTAHPHNDSACIYPDITCGSTSDFFRVDIDGCSTPRKSPPSVTPSPLRAGPDGRKRRRHGSSCGFFSLTFL